jgi:hypothetical protein
MLDDVSSLWRQVRIDYDVSVVVLTGA